MTRTKRNSAKNRAKIYGFSEFRLSRKSSETILYNLCRKILVLDTVDNGCSNIQKRTLVS